MQISPTEESVQNSAGEYYKPRIGGAGPACKRVRFVLVVLDCGMPDGAYQADCAERQIYIRNLCGADYEAR